MRLHRPSPVINDAIEVLDFRLKEAKGDVAEAWTRLAPVELEFVVEEISRCVIDRMYYLQTFHTIVTEQGRVMTLFPAWDHQLQVEESLQRQIETEGQAKIIVLKPRQAGITEYANGVMCWRTFFLPNAYTISVAQAPDVAAHIQRKINSCWDHLPWWLRPERQYHTKGEYLEFNRKDIDERSSDPGLGSVFVTTHAQRSAGVAIGRTVRSAHFSEVSRWPSGEVYSGDIEPSMNASDTIAIAESTALGSEGFYHNLWQEAIEGESDWTPVFLPAYRAKKFSLPLKPNQIPFQLTVVEAAMKERVIEEESFTITDEFFNWRRRRIKSSIKRTGFPYAHMESYPCTAKEAFQSSGMSAFPRHKLDEQQQACVRRPRFIGEIVYQGMNAKPKAIMRQVVQGEQLEKRELENRLYLWEEQQPTDRYYISADVGDGILGGDFSVAQIMRAGNGMSPDVQVGEWVGYEQPEQFARILYALGMMFNKPEIAVEYAREGVTTANYLANDLEYPNIYRPRSRDRIGRQLANYLHWQTTSKTKVLIKSKMAETLLENGIVIRSQYLLDELYKFVRIGASWGGLGGHDDAAMAMQICLFCLRETMPELRAPQDNDDASNQSPTSGARATGGGYIYGIYDEYFRLRAQTRDMAKAHAMVNEHPGWRIKPIVVSKANTAYSPIHHGRGAENQMLREGMESRDILPSLITVWKGAVSPRNQDVDDINSLANGEDGGWGSSD